MLQGILVLKFVKIMTHENAHLQRRKQNKPDGSLPLHSTILAL